MCWFERVLKRNCVAPCMAITADASIMRLELRGELLCEMLSIFTRNREDHLVRIYRPSLNPYRLGYMSRS